MYNTDSHGQPLPSAGQLIRSTIIALISAAVLLVCVVLPSEYAVDPTGAGRLLGLTDMGEIKQQLEAEAAADAAADAAAVTTGPIAQPLQAAVISTPASQPAVKPVSEQPVAKPAAIQVAASTVTTLAVAEPAAEIKAEPVNSDSISFVLKPGQGAEVKLEMQQDATVVYTWSANGGKLNYDTHGDPYNAPKGFYHGYGKGRFAPGDAGELKAAFDGKHGWFWRNRTKQDVTMTLEVSGDFSNMKRVI